MRKAVEAALRTRSYANLGWLTVLNLSQTATRRLHRLFETKKEIKKVAIILITSNRGLCGGFNSAIINKVHKSIMKHAGPDGRPMATEFILAGKKGSAVYRYFGYNIVADFPKSDLTGGMAEIIPLAKMIIKDFLNDKYDKIFVAYTDFVSAIKQTPVIRQILPIDEKAHKDFLGAIANQYEQGRENNNKTTDYIFEPNSQEVLNEMLPRLIEVQLYQALLESNASEHSARMSAMHQATEAAGDLVDDLTLFYNKARQAGITREIAEISAGANALR